MKCFLSLLIFFFVSSCALFKKSETVGRIETKGTYFIVNQKMYLSGQDTLTSKFEGFVFDDYSKAPISYGLVFSIDDNQYITTIDSTGYFCLLLPHGEYRFKITSVGNKDLVTEPIKLYNNTQTQIKVYLGSDIMYEFR